jgi:hypothetical protein
MGRLKISKSQRVVTGVLAVMRVKAACSPSHFTTGTDDGAVRVDRQTPQTELLNLFIEQFAVDSCPARQLTRAINRQL